MVAPRGGWVLRDDCLYLAAGPVWQEMVWFTEMKHNWAEIQHERLYLKQKHEDYKYFVWRDGKDKAGHMPHHYKEDK